MHEERNIKCMTKYYKYVLSVIALMLLVLLPTEALAFQSVQKSYGLSKGVMYKQYQYQNGGAQAVNHMIIDVTNPTTEVQLGLPTKANAKAPTTTMAMNNSREGNRVVGAINAGFFNMAEGFPLFLLAENNHIVNGGVVSQGNDEFMNVPTAFGVTANGKGLIDYFDFKINLSHGDKNYKMDGMNRGRRAYESMIYTPQFYKATTDTNEYGFEIVVDTGQPVTENKFGQKLTGTVTYIKPYGSKENLAIPRNGFVISLQGWNWYETLRHINVGEQVSVDFSIDKLWQNAQFMIASGPMLVQNGRTDIKMSTTSWRATEKAPRTVVATSENGNKVHFITVDGRQSHSRGMNMVQLANYLVSLGMESAINLDGGGSTTMAIRNQGSSNLVVANRPSNSGGYQRYVANTLQAVSTAPVGPPKYITMAIEKDGTFLLGATSSLKITSAMDENYVPVPIDNRFALTSDNNTFQFEGMRYKALAVGQDRINITYDGVPVKSFPVTTVERPTTMAITPSNLTLDAGATKQFTLNNVKATNGGSFVYDTDQINWLVEGDIGSINAQGRFVASSVSQGQSGRIIAQLGTTQVATNVTIAKPRLFKDIPTDYAYNKELSYLIENSIINGYDDNTFKPDSPLLRQHAAKIISNVLRLDTKNVTNPQFKDVPTTHPYYGEIAALANKGIISGANGNFNPSGQLTRAQMAKILALAFDLTQMSDKNFTDVSVNDWSYEYIQKLAGHNITTGYDNGSFKPQNAITRMHFGLFVYRTLHQ